MKLMYDWSLWPGVPVKIAGALITFIDGRLNDNIYEIELMCLSEDTTNGT